MRLKNYTDIPSDEIREIIRAVRPAGISNFDVRIGNCGAGAFAGRAYINGCAYHDTADPLIICRIWRKDIRCIKKGGKGYLPMVIGSRREALVMVLAHELRHLWQRNHSRGRVYGARGKYSERDADAYALQMLRRYRRGELLCRPSADVLQPPVALQKIALER